MLRWGQPLPSRFCTMPSPSTPASASGFERSNLLKEEKTSAAQDREILAAACCVQNPAWHSATLALVHSSEHRLLAGARRSIGGFVSRVRAHFLVAIHV